MRTKGNLSGTLDFLGLVDLLQLLGANGSSGSLRIESKYAAGIGVIYFSNGDPIDASSGPLKGLEALYSLFGWTEGEFEFRKDNIKRKRVINSSRMEVILDGLKKLDEGEIKKLGPEAMAQIFEDPSGKGTGIPIIKGPLVDYTFVVDEEEFSDGAKIIEEGRHGNWIWVILEGVVDITRETSQGPITIVKLGEGAFIGSMTAFLLEGNTRSASAVAVGKVQLGVIDSQRISSEYARMSPEFKGLLKSLDKRLSQISQRIVDFYQQENRLNEFTKDTKPVIKQGETKENLYAVTQGNAFVIRSTNNVQIPLVALGLEDYFGYHPFLNMGQEPHSAMVYGTQDLEFKELDHEKLHSEYGQMSSTVKHIIENKGICISMTTKVVNDLHGNKK